MLTAMLALLISFVLSVILVPSCAGPDAEVVFYAHDGYVFSRDEQRTIRTLAESAARDAKLLLPNLPARVIIRVNPGKQVIEEIGAGISPTPPNVVYWMVDPARGVSATAHAHLRATLFYAFHRLARVQHVRATTLMDHVIDEGMAAAFERDFGRRRYPWHQYPPEVAEWAAKLLALPPTAEPNEWMVRQEWMGIRAGLYLVDQAMRASGKSAADLVSTPTAEIVRLATVGSSP